MNPKGHVLAIGALALLWPHGASACTTPPPMPPPEFWILDHGLDMSTNKRDFWIGIEINIFEPISPTNCACGLGLGSIANPIPPGLDPMVTGVSVAKVRKLPNGDHELTPIPEFDPLLPAPTGGAWAGGPGATPGSNWTGFGGNIPPFTPPPLDPDEVYKLFFRVLVNPTPVVLPLELQVGGGEGDPDFNPLFGGDHSAQYWSAEASVIMIPTHSTITLLAIGGIATLRRRR